MSQFMNPANVYWSAPQYTQTNLKPVWGHLGFLMNLPYPDPVSTQATYGEGNENIYGKRELVFTELPEMHAIANVMPTTGGFPRVDPNSLQATHSLAAYTVRR